MQAPDLLLEIPRPSSVTPDLIAVRNILLATDFSECSTRTLGYALGIAAATSRGYIYFIVLIRHLTTGQILRQCRPPAMMPDVISIGWWRTSAAKGMQEI